MRLLAHAGVYEFLVSGPPPDDAIEAKRIKHDFVCAVSERSGGMDDSARRAIDAIAKSGRAWATSRYYSCAVSHEFLFV